MKTCPFCREQIHDDAIKCRCCGSSLLPPQPALQPESAQNNDASQVIYVGANQFAYILDKGLIRFAKFAFAVLALLITGAAIVGGFDIQHGVEKVEDGIGKVGNGIDKVRDLEDKARNSKDTVEKMVKKVQEIEEGVKSSSRRIAEIESQVGKLRDESQKLRDEAESFVTMINKNKPMVLALLHLTGAEATVIT